MHCLYPISRHTFIEFFSYKLIMHFGQHSSAVFSSILRKLSMPLMLAFAMLCATQSAHASDPPATSAGSVLFPEYERYFRIKSNALVNAALVPNIGVEAAFDKHFSFEAQLMYSPFTVARNYKLRILATQPELRYWTRDNKSGHFVGVHCPLAGVNEGCGAVRNQDPNRALCRLRRPYGWGRFLDKRRRWSVEFMVGVGYMNYSYDAYCNVPNGQKIGSGGGGYWGLTKAGISFSYNIGCHRKK
mgnify:FL=1